MYSKVCTSHRTMNGDGNVARLTGEASSLKKADRPMHPCKQATAQWSTRLG